MMSYWGLGWQKKKKNNTNLGKVIENFERTIQLSSRCLLNKIRVEIIGRLVVF